MSNGQSTGTDDEPGNVRTVTLFDVFDFLVARWRYLAGGMILGAALGLTYALLATPIYRATVVLTPVSSSEQSGALGRIAGEFSGLASLAGIAVGEQNGTDEAIAILKSRAFAAQIILEEGMLPLFFARKWDARAKQWRVKDEEVPTMADAFEYFDKRVRFVMEDRERRLVTLRIEWKDPELSAQWANTIVQRVNELLRARRTAELDKSLAYLDRELAKNPVLDLREAIYKVIEGQIKERMLASVREDFAFRVIDPAVVSDHDRFVRPKRALIGVLSAVAGLLGGAVLSMLIAYGRSARSSQTSKSRPAR